MKRARKDKRLQERNKDLWPNLVFTGKGDDDEVAGHLGSPLEKQKVTRSHLQHPKHPLNFAVAEERFSIQAGLFLLEAAKSCQSLLFGLFYFFFFGHFSWFSAKKTATLRFSFAQHRIVIHSLTILSGKLPAAPIGLPASSHPPHNSTGYRKQHHRDWYSQICVSWPSRSLATTMARLKCDLPSGYQKGCKFSSIRFQTLTSFPKWFCTSSLTRLRLLTAPLALPIGVP